MSSPLGPWSSRLLVVACSLVLVAISAAAERKPNIVFILADDLGYTDLACYGSRYYETPHLDQMAQGGLRFTEGYSCGPNCQPTRAALLSGQYGARTGVYTVGGIDRFDWQSRPLRPVDNVQTLSADRRTIAETLQSAGYATGMFGKWHLGSSAESHPGKRGFDEAIVSNGQHFDFKTDPRVDYPEGMYLADFLTEKATDFIRRHRDESFFLYLPHFGVHSPHQAKSEWIQHFEDKATADGHKNSTYAAMIASVDESVGRVLKTLDELQLSGQTLVIFSSDNGGVGGYAREGIRRGGDVTDNAPLRGGKGMLYEGGVRVPYLVRWPGVVPQGKTVSTPINSVDLYPTLLEVAGVTPPKEQVLDGTSYLNILKTGERASSERPPLFWHFPGYLGAGENTWRTTPVSVIRDGDWKLMEFHEDGRRELYDLQNDVGEKQNLAASQPERANQLLEKLVAWRQSIDAPMPTRNDATAARGKADGKAKGKGKGKGKGLGKRKQQNSAENPAGGTRPE